MISFTVFMINVKLFSVHRNRNRTDSKSAESNFRISKMLELADKDFISAVVIV